VAAGLFGSASAAGQISPFKTYSAASYGTGGIALRNRGTGVLHVSGVTGRVQDAYLYWAILFNTTTPGKTLYNALLTRVFPFPVSYPVTLQGTLLGIGADPCWSSKGVAVFRAQVPKSIAAGNGAYEVTIASGRTDGSDPWATSSVFPLAEGASMVIVGSGAWTVGIYDAGFTATTFYGSNPFTYTLNLPGPLSTDALWDNIGAGGQAGSSRHNVPYTDSETTTINSTQIAGPGTGTLNPDSDWNGSAGLPIPQLWDDTGHDIFSAVSGDTTAAFSIFAPGNCLVTVSNVLAVR
jgi:hypothetical protein